MFITAVCVIFLIYILYVLNKKLSQTAISATNKIETFLESLSQSDHSRPQSSSLLRMTDRRRLS